MWGEEYPLRETIDLPHRAFWPGSDMWLNAYGIHVLCGWWGLGGAVLIYTPLWSGVGRRADLGGSPVPPLVPAPILVSPQGGKGEQGLPGPSGLKGEKGARVSAQPCLLQHPSQPCPGGGLGCEPASPASQLETCSLAQLRDKGQELSRG